MLIDPRTGAYREPLLEDVRQVARLVDALPNMDTYESAVGAVDVPAETASLHKWEAAVHNTSKPVGTEATTAWDVRKVDRDGGHRCGRRGRASSPPHHRLRRLPGEPAAAAA